MEEINIVRKAQQEWMEFNEVKKQEGRKGIAETIPNQQLRSWIPPMEGVYKINTDGAISSQMIRTGKGIVARNWKEETLKVWRIMEEKIGDPKLEEALAIRIAMQLGKEASWRKIEIQSDWKSEIDCITTGSCIDWNCAMVLEDIQELREFFDQCNFSFIYRVGTKLCHKLVKFALKLVNDVLGETSRKSSSKNPICKLENQL